MLSPRLSHVIPAVLAAAALAFAGCGDSSDEAASPLDEALGYLPEDAGFALIASTDLEDYDDLRDVLGKFPFAGQAEDLLKQSLEQGDIDFDEQIAPLLGNEVVIGVDDNASFVNSSEETPFVLAIETEDGDKLEDFAKQGGSDEGSSEGYDIYKGQEDDTWIAIKDDVLVLSDNEDTLKNALKQRGEDDRLTEDDVDTAFEDLPEAPVQVYVNVAELLQADPDTQEALKVKWVEHLETLGLTASAADDAIALDYKLRTDPEGLSDEDLPIASGSEAPQVFEREGGRAEVLLGLRDLSQVVDFSLATAKVIDPAGYAEFQAGKETIGRRLGVDLDEDVLAQLTGDVSAAVDIDGKFGLRAELEDADTFEKTLAKVMDRLPEFSGDVTVTKPKTGDRFYGVASGGESYAVGVANDALVVANDAPLAAAVATRDLVDAEGQEGAFVASADAEQLANAVLAQFSSGLEGFGGALFTGPLGDLLTSAEASTDGLTGQLKLEIE